MKHYAPMTNGDEFDLLDSRTRRYVGHSEEFLAETKRRYRKRERRALGRMVEELVIEELNDDLAYWSAELDKALDEHGRIVDEYTEDERIFERFGDVPDWDYYETRFAELRKRIDVANRECYTAA